VFRFDVFELWFGRAGQIPAVADVQVYHVYQFVRFYFVLIVVWWVAKSGLKLNTPKKLNS